MKIRKLQLKNIGVFDDETIEFQPCPANDKAEIHIFTGQNGSGKTTLLMALASAFEYLESPHEKAQTEKDFFKSWSDLFQNATPKDEKEKQLLNPLKNMLWLLESRNKLSELSAINGTKTGFDKRFRYFESLGENKGTKSYSSVVFDGNMQSVTYGCQCGNTHTFHQDNMLKVYGGLINEKKALPNVIFNTISLAYSGYRRIKDEKIELGKEIDENPLYQSLSFVKDENSKFTINQWLGRNLSRRALAKEEKDDSVFFDENIKNLEKIIAEVVGKQIRFKLKTDLSLVVIENHNKSERELDFDVLPDGLKSLISWIGDLLMRLDSLKWENNTPIFDREIILFLDEIEVHLHPAWQRKVLPVVQKLFKNSQIFVSTHSPFVVNSVDDAWVYKLKVDDKGKAKVESVERSEDARSYRYVLRNTFDIENEFGIEIEKRLADFYKERDSFLAGNGNSKKAKTELKKIAGELSKQSKELKGKIDFELFQLSEITGEDF